MSFGGYTTKDLQGAYLAGVRKFGTNAAGKLPDSLQKMADELKARRVAQGHAGHANDVPKAGGGHGGNPNHDEHGRFT